jgi:O-antigen/teichoic acid export membrane protein
MKKFVKEGTQEVRGIFDRIRRRDFSGNTGQAVKNSIYQIAVTVTTKVGALIFSILIARMLLPELYGYYLLTLSTILLFATLSDFGIGTTLITILPEKIGKNNLPKTKAYHNTLFKYKIFLMILSSGLLILLSYFITHYYYNKPIFYAVLTGAIYIPVIGLTSYFDHLFKADNLFNESFKKEIFFQILRFTIVPLVIFYYLSKGSLDSGIIVKVFLAICSCYLITFILFRLTANKKLKFLKSKENPLTPSEKQKLRRFMWPLSLTAASTLFFGYIDTIMLGHYLSSSEYIGYYGATFGLIEAAGAILTFASIGLMPIFSKLKRNELNRAFKKTLSLLLPLTILCAIFTIIFAKPIILIYGSAYLPAVPLMQLFSILLVLLPILALYNSFFISIRKTNIIALFSIISMVLNIILNLFFIVYGLQFGPFYALVGAGVATILSRLFYMVALIISEKIISKT